MKKYCAIVKADQNYFLAAIQKQENTIVFENFSEGSLETLSKIYSTYGLALAISSEETRSDTWFFPKNTSATEIYQHISRQQPQHYFDFEYLPSETSEVLVLSHSISAINIQRFKQPYENAGFHIVSIEPLAQVKQRTLDKSWQIQALKNFHQKHATAEIALKLLDQDNFYDT